MTAALELGAHSLLLLQCLLSGIIGHGAITVAGALVLTIMASAVSTIAAVQSISTIETVSSMTAVCYVLSTGMSMSIPGGMRLGIAVTTTGEMPWWLGSDIG